MVIQKNELKNTDLVNQISQSLNEASWFLDHRLKAFSLLSELEAPEIERLDYSSWNLFEPSDVKAEPGDFSQVEALGKEVDFDFVQRSSGVLKEVAQADEQIIISDYSGLSNKEADLFKELYAASDFVDFKDSFNAFNSAFLTSGIFVYIPRGFEVEEPIKIALIDDQLAGGAKNHQVFIYAEENSSVEIIESYSSVEDKDQASKLTVHVHIQMGPGAIVKYTGIDELDKNTQTFFRRTGRTGRDAALELALGIMNDGHTIEDVQVDLLGDGSSADVKSVAISRSKQIQCVNTQVINHGSYTVGNIYQHGVVLEQARLTFNGVGDVLKNAKHSDAQQESRILMLSDEARADTNPILLIDEYELTAGHAASISRVDEAQLYYLMSRGLEKKQAERLVIRGFLGSVLSAISVKEVREKFIETIERKLSTL